MTEIIILIEIYRGIIHQVTAYTDPAKFNIAHNNAIQNWIKNMDEWEIATFTIRTHHARQSAEELLTIIGAELQTAGERIIE